MKNICISLLCIVALAATGFANTAPRHKKPTKPASSKADKKTPSLTSQEKKLNGTVQDFDVLMKSIIKQQTKENKAKAISWEQFLKKNKETSDEAFALNSMQPSLFERLTIGFYKTGEPHWPSMVQLEKFLFLAETVPGTTQAPQAVVSALRELRAAYPDKQILLATEFVRNEQPTSSLLHKANAQDDQLTDRYGLFAFTNELQIDVLALNDYIVTKDKSNASFKVGDVSIKIPLDSPLLTQNSDEDMDRSLKGSVYGLDKTNRQWAQRIEQVADNYDLIVVYTTADHVVAPFSSFPNQLQATAATTVILSPALEQVPSKARAEQNSLISNREKWKDEYSQFLQQQGDKAKNSKTKNAYQYKKAEWDKPLYQDIYPVADKLRSFHATETAKQLGLTNEDAAQYIFSEPFYMEANSASFTAGMILLDSEQQKTRRELSPWEKAHPLEGSLFFYHIGNASPENFLPTK